MYIHLVCDEKDWKKKCETQNICKVQHPNKKCSEQCYEHLEKKV